MSLALDPVPLLLHAVGALVLSWLGVRSARWVVAARGADETGDGSARAASALGWPVAVAAVALGALALLAWWSTADDVSLAAADAGLGQVDAGVTSSAWVSVVVPLLALGWAVAAWRTQGLRAR